MQQCLGGRWIGTVARLPGTSPQAMAFSAQQYWMGPVLATQLAQCQPYGLQSSSRNPRTPTLTLSCCNPLQWAELLGSPALCSFEDRSFMPIYFLLFIGILFIPAYLCSCCSSPRECSLALSTNLRLYGVEETSRFESQLNT